MSATAVPLRPIAKGSVVKLWLGLALLALVAAGVAWAGTASLLYTTTASGLQYRVLKEGEGGVPTEADIAFVTYTGRRPDGKVFDSNEGQQPTPFPVAEGATIKGFSEGLKLMRKGGAYRLRIPAALGYGDKASGEIPPNTPLEFDIVMHGFMPEQELRAIMMQQQQQQMGLGAPPQGAPGDGPPGGEAPPAGERE